MRNYYEKFNLPYIVNAAGKWTIYGACRTFPKAAQAMVEASQNYVELGTLLEKSGEYISGILNVEAALVTAGASPALIQATAACMVGIDPFGRSRLPSCPPSRCEVIIQRFHRNPYDNAVLTAGAKFIEIGNSMKTHPWELEGVINNNTAAVVYAFCTVQPDSVLSLEETIAISHKHGVPVIVDAAPNLPPKSNLWTLAQQGADLVVFSGGKDIRGPQTSGLIVGKKELVEAAAFNGAPNYGVGRPMKASKEIVAGLVAALECYLEENEEERYACWNHIQQEWISALDNCAGWKATPHQQGPSDLLPASVPRVDLTPPVGSKMSVTELVNRLKQGNPMILVDQNQTSVVLNPFPLEGDEWQIITAKILEELRKDSLLINNLPHI